MRMISTTTASYHAKRDGYAARVLLWIAARDRATGDLAPRGLWNGSYDRSFTIGGEERVYIGAGGLLALDPIVFRIGLGVSMQRAVLSGVDPAVADIIRGFDVRLAPVEIHRALFWPESGFLVEEPARRFKGHVDNLRIITPELGGEATVEMAMASQSRTLTRTLAHKKSDESQRLRSGDRFRRYADVSDVVSVFWGEGGPGRPHSIAGRSRTTDYRPDESSSK
jgi:hypothetical protein